jgi:hypothetical protein
MGSGSRGLNVRGTGTMIAQAARASGKNRSELQYVTRLCHVDHIVARKLTDARARNAAPPLALAALSAGPAAAL